MERQKIDFLRNKDIVMVTCAVICRTEEVAEYIKKRCHNFASITFTPYYIKSTLSLCSSYKENELEKQFKLLTIRKFFLVKGFLLLLISYINYIFSVFYSFGRLKKKFDIYIGVGHFYTFIGLIIKKLGICQKVVYYCGDYFEVNKKSDYKRKVFQLFDKFDVRYVDAIWNHSPATIKSRKKAEVVIRKGIPNFFMLIGLNLNKASLKDNLFNTNNLVFIGNLQSGRGFDIILEVFPRLNKKIPDIKLHIIGTGTYKDELIKKIQELNLNNYIILHDFIDSEQLLDKIFSKSVIGLALYAPKQSDFLKYGNAGKIMEYLSYGLPVIATKTSPIAERIEEYGAGAVINYSSSELEQTILKFLKDRQFLKSSAAGARSLALEYTWNKILDRAFHEIFTGWQKMNKSTL